MKTVQDSNFILNSTVKNDSEVEFLQTGMITTSGKAKACNNIPAKGTAAPACEGQGTDGTMTGLVGYAGWWAAVGLNKIAKLTLNFDMPFDGGNVGSFTGDANFNEYFEI
jgi:hypothetical protein